MITGDSIDTGCSRTGLLQRSSKEIYDDGFKVYDILVRHKWNVIQPSRFLMWCLNDHSPNAKRP